MQHEEFLENPKANTQIAARLNRCGLIANPELTAQLSVVGSRGKDFCRLDRERFNSAWDGVRLWWGLLVGKALSAEAARSTYSYTELLSHLTLLADPKIGFSSSYCERGKKKRKGGQNVFTNYKLEFEYFQDNQLRTRLP